MTNWPGAADGSNGNRSVTVEGVSWTRSETVTTVRTGLARALAIRARRTDC